MSGRRLTVTQWFAALVALLLVVAAAGLIASLVAQTRLTDRRRLLLDRIAPAQIAALRLSSSLLDQESGVRGFVLGGDESFLDPYRQGRRAAAEDVRTLERLHRAPELEAARADLRAVRVGAERWLRDYAEPAIHAVRAGREPPAPSAGRDLFDPVRAALARQDRDLAGARAKGRRAVDAGARLVRRLSLAAGVLALLSVLLAAYALRRGVLEPLGRLAGDVRTIARDGDFSRALRPSGPREIAQLGEDVDAMRARLAEELRALRDAEIALIDQAGELQRSNEELEQFAYVASHDLQEPLRKIASFTQMLQRRYEGQLDERADRYIAFAVDGAKRMQQLINDLLEFSRVGRHTHPHERVDAGALVEQACARLAALLEEAGAEVVVDGELPTVSGDAGLLTAVFQNLIANGVKFRGEAPPRVEIAARREGRCWRFSVTDNGIGIDDEYADRIFVIFQRLHTRDTYDGTGIGLAMCRKIIEYHGGRISLASAAEGRGARFEFTLPAGDDGNPEEET